MQTWRRNLSGSLAEIATVAQWIDEIISTLELPSHTSYALRVCAEELLTNIVRHGGASSKIDVSLTRFSNRLELVVEDNGSPFDVSAATPRRVDHPIEKAEPGGLGVQLIHNYADRLSYCRAGLGNRVVVEFTLPPEFEAAVVGAKR
jgi:anti-sigma regulatory factor (Ser/Thr protein kinase)